jgi:hypothetical protein
MTDTIIIALKRLQEAIHALARRVDHGTAT